MIDFDFEGVFPDSRFHFFLQGDLVNLPGFLGQLARSPRSTAVTISASGCIVAFLPLGAASEE